MPFMPDPTGVVLNIWTDPEAAAYVRTTNEGGNEVVPTVVMDGVSHTTTHSCS
jgi:hypothetical protein